MTQSFNFLLFLTEAAIYFSVMLGFLHFRRRLGLGVFLTALGVMHFLETYLAATFYVQLPFGTVSPGSSVLFACKLMLILLLYIKEDAATVRQPIYGLFLGNLMTVAVAMILQFHVTEDFGPAGGTAFIKEMGWLMLWGTTVLYLDSIGIILLYEKLGRFMPRWVVLRFLISGMVVLTFDHLAFFSALYLFLDVPFEAFAGGWKAKLVSALFYASIYLLYTRIRRVDDTYASTRPLADVFGDLTFRERYEDLLARSGHDTLTGVFDRNRMEIDAPVMIRECLQPGGAVSMIIFDVDHFKAVNDRFGHLAGDEVLKALTRTVQETVRSEDRLYRFGGEEFVVMLPHLPHEGALATAERLRRAVAARLTTPDRMPVTASFGVATGPEDGASFPDLVAVADERLYAAKDAGRNCVRGQLVFRAAGAESRT